MPDFNGNIQYDIVVIININIYKYLINRDIKILRLRYNKILYHNCQVGGKR